MTAVVAGDSEALVKGRTYEVAFRAHLVYPYFIRLRQPVALLPLGESDEDWATAVESVWSQRVHQSLGQGCSPAAQPRSLDRFPCVVAKMVQMQPIQLALGAWVQLSLH